MTRRGASRITSKPLGSPGDVDVRKHDRGTGRAERERMRNNPSRILLTNYMMLEYLLIRPAARDPLFANHRRRFLVLQEVRTYRGVLGRNLAIYVDGAAFHVGARLRRDRLIRNRLREGPRHWTVVELRAADLARDQALVAELSAR